jgi:ribonuclease J
MIANAAIGRAMRIPQVEVCEDGDVVTLEDGLLTVERQAIAGGYVYVDGADVGEAETIIRDRRHLADDGVLIVTLGINFSTGEILFGPDVDSHGVTKDFDDMRDLITERIKVSIAALDVPVDPDILRRRVRNTATRAIKKIAGRRPVVLPVVIEV